MCTYLYLLLKKKRFTTRKGEEFSCVRGLALSHCTLIIRNGRIEGIQYNGTSYWLFRKGSDFYQFLEYSLLSLTFRNLPYLCENNEFCESRKTISTPLLISYRTRILRSDYSSMYSTNPRPLKTSPQTSRVVVSTYIIMTSDGVKTIIVTIRNKIHIILTYYYYRYYF